MNRHLILSSLHSKKKKKKLKIIQGHKHYSLFICESQKVIIDYSVNWNCSTPIITGLQTIKKITVHPAEDSKWKNISNSDHITPSM
jgi:hypothetical protein